MRYPKLSPRLRRVLTAALAALTVFAAWLALERSISELPVIFSRPFPVTLLNLLLTAVPFLLLLTLTGRPRLSAVAQVCVYGVFAAVNSFVYAMHGAPARLSELAALGTAADVLGGYKLTAPAALRDVLLFTAAALAAAVLMPADRLRGKRARLFTRLTALACAAVCCAASALMLRQGGLRPDLGYSWAVSVRTSGYPACLTEDTRQYFSSTVMPDGYTPEKAAEAAKRAAPAGGTAEPLPDVILILNETFYDPAVYAGLDLETDVPWMDAFSAVPGAARGYAVVPTTGTNSSEYELLTFHAKSLVNASAPFNFLHFGGADTVVSYMKALGYETWALHGMGGANYSRYIAYPEMGFDHILFQNDFTHSDRYGNRYRTDASDYEQLKDCWNAGGDAPRFLYLLTYQNHGGWEQNDASFDTVHCLRDPGCGADVMNEFLTGIRMSCEAVADLTAYFAASDRPVLLIMAGDHPPVFLSNRSDAEVDKDDDASVSAYLRRSATPYMIWSNRGPVPQEYDFITLTDLVPMAMRAAGMPLSGYCAALLNAQKEYPVHVSGFLLDPDGNLTRAASAADTPRSVLDALYLGYNDLQPPAARENVFRPERDAGR